MSRWARREDVVWRQTAGAVIAVAPGADEPVALTGPGVAVWHLLAAPTERDALVRWLADRYRDPASQIGRDVDALLEAMLAQQLVRSPS